MIIKDQLRIGVDIGGTFTDFVIFEPRSGSIHTFKLLSTPEDPARAVIDGLHHIGLFNGKDQRHSILVHGSTVATNALLERKGVRTALVTTLGFADVIQIGRQNRPELYNLFSSSISPLVPSILRFEVDERVNSSGQVIRKLYPYQIEKITPILHAEKVESVAVCLLFSFLYPEHETLISEYLRNEGFAVSSSCEILPEFREYERTSTTVINAYVSPLLKRYLTSLSSALPGEVHLRIMQSNGGTIDSGQAHHRGVRCILSGPAAGVVGCQYVAEITENKPDRKSSGLKLITFDMGGTSTDVSLIDGAPLVTNESKIGGLPVGIPVLDIHTIGAGGGSIATFDRGGALRVGPESAGSQPGPACYNPNPIGSKAEILLPTVTDANCVLGRLVPDHFLNGQMPLNLERAHWVINNLGTSYNMSATQTAMGIIEIVNAHMERALRLISVERGHDPHDFTMLSFGGAGGLHATDLARRLGIPCVLVPPYASVLSALGMLAANVVKDYSQTVMLPGDISTSELSIKSESLFKQASREMESEGFALDEVIFQYALDMRYKGQSYELTIPWQKGHSDYVKNFHENHHMQHGYAKYDEPVEIVNLRLRATGTVPHPPLPTLSPGSSDPSHAIIDYREVVFHVSNDHPSINNIPLFRGEVLLPGNQLQGPALVIRSDTTILLEAGDQAEVDAYQNLWIMVN